MQTLNPEVFLPAGRGFCGVLHLGLTGVALKNLQAKALRQLGCSLGKIKTQAFQDFRERVVSRTG